MNKYGALLVGLCLRLVVTCVGMQHICANQAIGAVQTTLDQPGSIIDDAQTTLAATEARLGKKHPYVAACLDNLAALRINVTDAIYGPGSHISIENDLNKNKRLHEAEQFYKRALEIRENALGPEHLDTLKNMDNLARLYTKNRLYTNAESLFNRALAIREKKLGPEHPDVIRNINELAGVYVKSSNDPDDNPCRYTIKRIASEIQKNKAIHRPNPLVAGLTRLAMLQSQEGQPAKALPIRERVLSILNNELGPNHPLTIEMVVRLANLHYKLGSPDKAESIINRYLGEMQTTFARNSPEIGFIYNELGVACSTRHEGVREKAESFHLQALAIREQTLGPGHLDIAESLVDLGNIYWGQNKFEQAEPLFYRALGILGMALGPADKDVEKVRRDITRLNSCRNKDKLVGSEAFFVDDLVAKERSFDINHPEVVAKSLFTLAGYYIKEGRPADTEPLYKRVLDTQGKSLPPSPPNPEDRTDSGLERLASYYREQKQDIEAEKLFKQVLEIREKAQGPNHYKTVQVMVELAKLYEEQERYADTDLLIEHFMNLGGEHFDASTFLFTRDGQDAQYYSLSKRIFAIRKKILGPDHPDLANDLLELSRFQIWHNENEQSEESRKQALAIREKRLGPTHVDTLDALINIVYFYKDQKQNDRAEAIIEHSLNLVEHHLGTDNPAFITYRMDLASRLFLGSQELAKKVLNYRGQELTIPRRIAAPPLFAEVDSLYKEIETSKKQPLGYAQEMKAYEHLLDLWNDKPWAWYPGPDFTIIMDLSHERYHTSEVELLLKKVLDIYQKEFGQDDPALIFPLSKLAAYYSRCNKPTLAISLYERILDLRAKFGFSSESELGNVAELYASLGQYEKAITTTKQLLETQQRVISPDSPFLANTLLQLEKFYTKNGQPTEAEKVLEQALILCEKNIPKEFCSVDPVDRLTQLATEYRDTKQYSKAEQLYSRALISRERKFGPDSTKSRMSMETAERLINLYRATGQNEKAGQLQKRFSLPPSSGKNSHINSN